MSDRNKKALRWILFLGWMIFIFYMSHQPGDKSSEQSRFVLYVFNLLGLKLDTYFGELATLIIRKGAHFTEYFILFILTYNVISLYVVERKARLYSVIFVFLYACSDEFYQSFIPGRGPAFKDVMIDTSGGLLGYLCVSIYNKINIKKGSYS
ncbi:MAG: VanZ family protein [Clostridium sp.]|uniref:VanZ family protein n=1 Tax=Clostridium sp. TaxID=1506 RepID=UPI0029098071|nr:VanZ family protein [Clostridium sp.]MDU4939678.1 VanZ family protein [Clostridium sp.]